MPNAVITFTVTEVLRAIVELDEGEERVSWRVGIVRVLALTIGRPLCWWQFTVPDCSTYGGE